MQNFKSLEIPFSKASYISRKGRPPSRLGTCWWPGAQELLARWEAPRIAAEGEVVSGRAEMQPRRAAGWVWSTQVACFLCCMLNVTVHATGQLGNSPFAGFFMTDFFFFFFCLVGSCNQPVKYVKTYSVLLVF